MAKRMPPLTIGVEEEMFIVDKTTGKMVSQIPEELHKRFQKIFPKQIVSEFFSSQVEILTQPCNNIAELHDELRRLRSCVVEESAKFNFAPFAASTHPTASWLEQKPNTMMRYRRLKNVLQAAARRMLVGGMHIHIGIDKRNERLRILNQLSWYLPYLLALSTSSPYWKETDTGLNSYRISVIDTLPRTGLPERFHKISDYERYLQVLMREGVVNDATELWWDARMSCRFPTVEMRITDVCPRLDDTIAIAAFYQSLVRYLCRNDFHLPQDEHILSVLLEENRWRVQRFRLKDISLFSKTAKKLQTLHHVIYFLLNELVEDAEALGCVDQLLLMDNLLQRGTSADRQRKVFRDATASGDSEKNAFKKVVKSVVAETSDV